MRTTKELNKMRVGAHDCAQKGITLIVLVITVIVMLILVSVTIAMAVNGGLFDYAGKATGETENAINAEQALGSGKVEIDGKWYNNMEDYLNNKPLVILPEGLKVGDYVNYIPNTGIYKVADGEYGSGVITDEGYQEFTTEELEWRVWSIDKETGEIELVSATTTMAQLNLSGADGYNHAVDILNDMCEALYSNSNGAIARSINVEDINAKTTYDYTTYNDGTYTYGDKIQLSTFGTSRMNYPNLYSQETGFGIAGTFNIGLRECEGLGDGVTDNSGITKYSTVTGSTNGSSEETDVYVTYTYYNYTPESYLADLGINSAPEGLITVSSSYWVASRNIDLKKYSIRCINFKSQVAQCWMLDGSGNFSGAPYGIRPLVTLGLNVSLTKDTTNSTDDVTYWNIEY